jgi:hypothetical protein
VSLEQRVRAVSVHCHVIICRSSKPSVYRSGPRIFVQGAFELIYAQADKAGRIISAIKYLRTKQTKINE